MAKVIEFHPPPRGNRDDYAQEVIDWVEDMTGEIKAQKAFGRIVHGAIVLINDEDMVVTSYAGKTHTFTIAGAYKFMSDRMYRENHDR